MLWECSGSALGVFWGGAGNSRTHRRDCAEQISNRTNYTAAIPERPRANIGPPSPPILCRRGCRCVPCGVCGVFSNSPLLRDTIFTSSRKTPAETFDDFCKQGPVLSKVCPGVFFWGLGGHPRPLWGTPRNTFANTTDDRRQTTDDRRQLTDDR